MNARRAAAIALAAWLACACATEEIELPQPPSAFAGFDAFVSIGSNVVLDGSLSSDPDGDALSFSWRLAASPEGSTARIADASARVTTIVPDVRGTWVVSLTVSDGRLASRDLVAFTATASTATASRPQLSLEPSSSNAVLTRDRIIFDAISSGASTDEMLETYAIRVPAGATEDELSLTATGFEISFIAPRPGEYWIAALLRSDSAISPPAIATVAVFEDALARPRADLRAPRTARINERVLLDGRATEGAAPTTWRLLADPSSGIDTLLDVATGCPAGTCRLLLPSRLGTYVVALEIEGGVTAVHALEVLE